MRKYSIIFYFVLISGIAFSQEPSKAHLDSLFTLFVHIKSYSIEGLSSGPAYLDTVKIKCGFELVNEIKINLRYFTEQQHNILMKLLVRPSEDTSIVSPGGFFRIHYSLSGVNAPVYSVTLLAQALDSTYNFEVNYLGFPHPPGDSIVNATPSDYGGDNRYDVYISNLGTSEYGSTYFENEVTPGSGRYTSYMVINSDFTLFSKPEYHLDYNGPNGIYAARVTVAHEFHHSIQGGDYIFRSSDSFFYEMTSTSMEHFVFGTIHDYYQYLPNYFRNPDRPFALNNGYNIPIWNFYLKDKYGYGIIKRQWQLMPQMRAIKAINSSLTEHNSNFGRELNEFGIWTYFTGYRTYTGKYFKEAANYPLISTNPLITFNPPNSSVNLDVSPLSNNFLKFYVPSQNDTLTAIITNGNVIAGVDSQYNLYPITYYLYTYSENGSIKITDNYFEKLTSENPNQYFDSEILNNILVKQDTTINKTADNSIDYAFPNPFDYSKYYQNGQYISFAVKIPFSQKADVNIYSVSMNLIYSGSLKVTDWSTKLNIIKWNVLDSKGRKLASGVYFYIIKYGNQTYKGKFVVFQ